MAEQTIGSIAMGPSGNLQGGVRFFSLDTGKLINQPKSDYTLLPMPADVIKRINRRMAKNSWADLIFTDSHNNLVYEDANQDTNDDL